jgi:hypothetical protein
MQLCAAIFQIGADQVRYSQYWGNSKRLIPIRTFERDKFPSLFDNVALAEDGQWIDI